MPRLLSLSGSGSVSPSRPSARASRATSQAQPGSSSRHVIDLAGSDSDSDVEITGQQAAPDPSGWLPPRRVERRARPQNEQARRFTQAMDEIDASLARNRAELARLPEFDLPDAAGGRRSRQASRSPPPPRQPGGPIRLGGAVFRNGTNEIRFAPGRAPVRFLVDEDGPQEVPASPERPQRPRRNARRFALDDDNPGGGGGNVGVQLGGNAFPVGGARFFFGLNGAEAHLRNLVGRLYDVVGPARAGRAAPDDVPTILAKVSAPAIPDAPKGFTHTWDPEELVEAKTQVIRIDGAGASPAKRQGSPYLACANCPEPLRVSSGYRDTADRVWALRCGHMLDQRCLDILCAGADIDPALADLPLLDEGDSPPSKRRRTGRRPARRATRQKAELREHQWHCPVKGCGREHVSVLTDGVWTQKEGEGATQLFV